MLVILQYLLFLLSLLLSPHIFAPRSLAGGEEVPAEIPEQGETKREGGAVEDIEAQQQQTVDEEVQSIQGHEGRKVRRWATRFNVMFVFLLCVFLSECSQCTVEEKQPPAPRRPWEPDRDTDGGARG